VFVGEHEIIAQGLKAMLAQYRDRVELIGHVLSTEDLMAMATRLSPDVALLELPLQTTSALDLVAEKPPFRVVIFTDDADERRLFEALRLGASGYLLKSLSGTELADQLVRVHDGEVVVDPTMATRIALRTAHAGAGRTWPGSEVGLSQRESEVLALLTKGFSNRLMAAELVLGEETIKTHLRSVYRKLGVNDRAQAVSTALRQGICA
jgi:DNA-binding NarL/FixJ family response regulator